MLTSGAVAVQFLPGRGIERFAQKAADWSALGLMLSGGLRLIEMIGPQGVAPFIYFQF